MEPTRFDTVESNVKKQTHKNLYNARYNDMMKDYNRQLARTIEPDSKASGISPFEIKQQLMRGNGNLIGSG